MRQAGQTIVIMPAYHAEKTLEATVAGLPPLYSEIILCDDASGDNTYELAQRLDITAIRHEKNRGYGGNQKTLFKEALARKPAMVVMVHPDNQYETKCLPDMITLLEHDSHIGMVLGSRMKTAISNDMPRWKFLGNRFLTMCENVIFKTDLSEFHSGLRAYRADVLAQIPYETFSEGFVFDSEIIAWLVANKFEIAEVETNCYYAPESSSLGAKGSIRYGFLTLATLVKYLFGYYRDKPATHVDE